MRYVLTASEMKHCDEWTIQELGIPAPVLMERAALAMKEEITNYMLRSSMPDAQMLSSIRVLIAAGTGNNGGDGLALGRLLALDGAQVDFYFPGSRRHMSKECQLQAAILKRLGFFLSEKIPQKEYDVVVDALFGIGLTRDIEGIYKEAVEQIHRLKDKGAFVCAADIPSGVCADTGRILGCGVKADLTVTFAFAKRGHLYYPGREYTGELIVRDVGILWEAGKKAPQAFSLEKEDVGRLLPKRKSDGNKGTFGKVLAAAGSRDMAGACILCGEAVLRTGAGMVKLVSPACNREILQSALPEAMLYSYEEEAEEEPLKASLDWADVVAAGPGMGTGERSYKLLRSLLSYVCQQEKMSLVLDADALNLLARHQELKELLKNRRGGQVVLTPHPGELVRLMGSSMEDYYRDREGMVTALAKELNCVVVGKDAVTLVAGTEADTREEYHIPFYLNTSGSHGMATAGSGDVLCGVIGALLAQGMRAFDASCLGVFIHGTAGEEASKKKSAYGMKASDLIEEICILLSEQNGKAGHKK